MGHIAVGQPAMVQPGVVHPTTGATKSSAHPFDMEGAASDDEKTGKSSSVKGAIKDSFFKSERKISDDSDRLGFIKKVYSICAVMIGITVAVTVKVFTDKELHAWMMQNLWLHYLCCFMTLFIALGIICCKGCAR